MKDLQPIDADEPVEPLERIAVARLVVMSYPEATRWQVSRQTPTRRDPSQVRDDRGEVLEAMAERATLAGRVFEQHHRLRRGGLALNATRIASAISRNASSSVRPCTCRDE